MVRLIVFKVRFLVSFVLMTVGGVLGTARGDYNFGAPTRVLGAAGFNNQWASSISADSLSLYFTSDQPGGSGGYDIWVTRRAGLSSPWGAPVNLGATVNSARAEMNPSISSDGLSLYFCDGAWIWSMPRSDGFGEADLWVTRRPTSDATWGPPVNLGPLVNSSAVEGVPSISSDNLSLYFESDRPGGVGSNDIWVTTRASPDDAWGEPVSLGPAVNSASDDIHPAISADGLALFFQSARVDTLDLWVSTRTDISSPFEPPVRIGPMIRSPQAVEYANVSPDGRTLFFTAEGVWNLWQAPIIRMVDLNGDGRVGGLEVRAMADGWGTDDALWDIGPMPWGDGVVDVEDLKVLAEFIGGEVDDPTLAAHWALDETEGDVAYDSLALHDGTLVGGPAWVPAGGMIDGALAFDGIDDHLELGEVVTPSDGPFSVFAWVQGSTPGGVIFSQSVAKNWLLLNPADGTLMTDLSPVGRYAFASLPSSAVIADGQWHRVGVVWDGRARALYVDDALVAEDVMTEGVGKLSNGLYLGCGVDKEASSFFSGLIDDVRIYNRAVRP